jgi:hypothetical protein
VEDLLLYPNERWVLDKKGTWQLDGVAMMKATASKIEELRHLGISEDQIAKAMETFTKDLLEEKVERRSEYMTSAAMTTCSAAILPPLSRRAHRERSKT